MDVRFADLKAIEYAGMAEQADATDLKSVDFESCGFKSHYPHFLGVYTVRGSGADWSKQEVLCSQKLTNKKVELV